MPFDLAPIIAGSHRRARTRPETSYVFWSILCKILLGTKNLLETVAILDKSPARRPHSLPSAILREASLFVEDTWRISTATYSYIRDPLGDQSPTHGPERHYR